MIRKRLFLALQTVLCALTAVLPAAGVISLYQWAQQKRLKEIMHLGIPDSNQSEEMQRKERRANG